jgi:hypothetical protein
MYSISAEGIKRKRSNTRNPKDAERGGKGEWKDRKVIAFHFIPLDPMYETRKE